MWVAPAPGMPGMFSPPPTSKDARVVMHVGIANPLWRGKCSRQSRRMPNPQLYVSGKRSILGKIINATKAYTLVQQSQETGITKNEFECSNLEGRCALSEATFYSPRCAPKSKDKKHITSMKIVQNGRCNACWVPSDPQMEIFYRWVEIYSGRYNVSAMGLGVVLFS